MFIVSLYKGDALAGQAEPTSRQPFEDFDKASRAIENHLQGASVVWSRGVFSTFIEDASTKNLLVRIYQKKAGE